MLEVGVKTDQTNGTYFLFGKDLQNLEFHNQKCFLRIKLFGAVLGFQQTLHIYFHLERFTAITSKGATIQENDSSDIENHLDFKKDPSGIQPS